MGNLFKRLRFLLANLNHSKTLGILALLIIIAAVPLTVFISQKQQDIRQKASGVSCNICDSQYQTDVDNCNNNYNSCLSQCQDWANGQADSQCYNSPYNCASAGDDCWNNCINTLYNSCVADPCNPNKNNCLTSTQNSYNTCKSSCHNDYCTVPSQCGTDSACKHPACQNNQCLTAYEDPGTGCTTDDGSSGKCSNDGFCLNIRDYCEHTSDCNSNNPCIIGICGKLEINLCTYDVQPNGTQCPGGTCQNQVCVQSGGGPPPPPPPPTGGCTGAPIGCNPGSWKTTSTDWGYCCDALITSCTQGQGAGVPYNCQNSVWVGTNINNAPECNSTCPYIPPPPVTCNSTVCSQVGNTCNEAYCNGNTCALRPRSNGTPCSGGSCQNGSCIPITPHVSISPVPTAPVGTIQCNTITLSATPSTVKVGDTINFKITGDGSTYFNDDFGGGVANCTGNWAVGGQGLTCTATTAGTYTWKHSWQHCVNSNCSSVCNGTQITYIVNQAASGGNLSAQFISRTCPTTMTTGQSTNVSVIMKNTGTTTWTQADLIRLGSQNPQDNLTWGLGRVDLGTNTVSPNANFTFNFTAKAPANSGNYNFQWKMLQEGNTWFGDPTPNCNVNVTGSTNPNDIIVNTSFHLLAIGNPLDRSNKNPKHPNRDMNIQVFDQSNNKITEKVNQVSYNSTTGNFDGALNLGQLQPGSYLVKAQTPKYLKKLITKIFIVTSGQTQYTISDVAAMIVGDINGDNKIDPLDYNVYLGCFGNKANNLSSCPNKEAVDINDDGLTDTITDNTDFAWWLESTRNQTGD